MQKRVVVISLGGSLIVPEDIDADFLKKFKDIILKNTDKHKFVIVCGGGSIARKYISALQNQSEYIKSLAGIAVTRLNARFISYFFNQDPEKGIPHNMEQVKNLLEKNDMVFCGALRYAKKETSDATAVKLAHFLETDFINLTNVQGLYDKNPLTNKNAHFIAKTTWLDLEKRANKPKYRPGQHFVIDQHASELIREHKIKAYILGKNLKNFERLIKGKSFVGTIIAG